MVTRGHERPVLGDLATLATSDDFDAIRERYLTDEPLPVPPDITSFINGKPVEVSLAL
ncbi:MAG TPA: hypothetical protein VK306_11680 [Acidimicrobiales bacterium]|nr:hypothetical protein [Acidimicrobiales bacterium]